MDPNDEAYLGRVAYEAYLSASGGVSLVSGQDLPSWDEQDDKIKKAWTSAARAVQKSLPVEVEQPDEPVEVHMDEAHRDSSDETA